MNRSTNQQLAAIAGFMVCGAFWDCDPVKAGPLTLLTPPSFQVRIEGFPNPPTWTYTPPAQQLEPVDDEGTYQLSTPYEQSILQQRAHFRLEELEFNADPFVLNNVLLTNNTPATQIFSVFVGLPTTFDTPNLLSGHVRTTVIDGGSDGATIQSVAPTPIYQAQIDLAPAATLQSDPFSVVAAAGGETSSFASFGPALSTASVLNSIGIQLRFQLTAGDTAAITSRFDVREGGIIVPEPGTLALLLAGPLVGFVSLARSRTPTGRRDYVSMFRRL